MQHDIFTRLEQIVRSARTLHNQGHKDQSRMLLESMRDIVSAEKPKPGVWDSVKAIPLHGAKR